MQSVTTPHSVAGGLRFISVKTLRDFRLISALHTLLNHHLPFSNGSCKADGGGEEDEEGLLGPKRPDIG